MISAAADMRGMSVSAGRLTFAQIMKMFRNELLDLNDILNYIRLAPQDSPAASAAVSAPAFGTETASGFDLRSLCPVLCLPLRLHFK